MQRPEQVREVDSTPTGESDPDGTPTDTEDSTPTEEADSDGTPTDTEVTTVRGIVDDFESGALSRAWHEIENKPAPQDREAFEVQSAVTGEGRFALRGKHDAYSKYSGIERDDFRIDRDGSSIRLYVKLGRVLTGSERANRIKFMDGSDKVLSVDQKDRPGTTDKAKVGNGNTPNSVMDSVTFVEFRNIKFSEDEVGEVVVDGTTVGTNMGFLNSGSRITAMKVYQGHFGQPDDIIVDGITYEMPSG